MDNYNKDKNQADRDPDFEVQETPDYTEPKEPGTRGLKLSQPEQSGSTASGTNKLPDDPDTLAIQKPIESLFAKDHAPESVPAKEEIELPSKRWSKRQEKKMKNKAKYREFSPEKPSYSEKPGYKPQPPSQEPKVTATIPPPPLVSEQTPVKSTVPPRETAALQYLQGGAFGSEAQARREQSRTTSVMPTVTPVKVHTVVTPPHPIPPSKGIAYVDNQNRIKITGGYKIYPGDVLKVGTQEFMLKDTKRNYTNYYIAGAVSLLLLILLISSLWSSKSSNSGNVTGIVVEQDGRALVPGASVSIKELGMKVLSNELGFFNFQMVPQGTYTIEAAVSGYNIVSDQTTITKKKTSNLALVLSPVVPLQAQPDEEQFTQTSAPVQTQFEPSDNRPGAIAFKVSPGDALVWVDDQNGKANSTFRNLKPGTHTVKVSKAGYKDWEKQVQVKSGQTSTISASLDKLTSSNLGSAPRSLDDYLSVAKEAYGSQDYSTAVRYYNQAAQMSSTRGEVYLGRGLAWAKIGDNKAASNDFLSAAQVYTETERYAQAAEAYSYFLELNPNNDNIRYQRGKTYLAAGNFTAAAKDISGYLESNPKSFNAVIDLGSAYYYAGEYQNAVEAFSKAKKINSMDKRTFVGLTKAYMGLGDRKACKSNYDKFRELASYMDREKLKEQDPEWQKVLNFLQIKEE
jgi:tetratricopeptide (TPR) repeat protein